MKTTKNDCIRTGSCPHVREDGFTSCRLQCGIIDAEHGLLDNDDSWTPSPTTDQRNELAYLNGGDPARRYPCDTHDLCPFGAESSEDCRAQCGYGIDDEEPDIDEFVEYNQRAGIDYWSDDYEVALDTYIMYDERQRRIEDEDKY